jgi:pyruvate ferredoxin oxidoreductase beta subunit
MTMKALQKPAIVVNATGCLEVASSIYPDTAWKVPWVHTLFENTAAVASGIEASLRREGKADAVDIVAFGGDGGTFDIGIQALSGALERKHDFTYICYDNEAYMNTGIQRSGATPYGAATTTTPAGSKIAGKTDAKKDLIGVCIAHGVEFAATASVAFWNDYITKVRRAAAVKGPAVIHVLAPCPLGWRFDTSQTIKLAKLAVQTRYFPLYEVEKGNYKLSMKVPNPTPLEEFLKPQGRFRHLFAPEFVNNLEELKRQVDSNWNRVARLCGEIPAPASPSPGQSAN